MAKAINIPSATPIWVSEVELSKPFADIDVPERQDEPFGKVRLLVRLYRKSIGYATFVVTPGEPVKADTVARELWSQLGTEIKLELAAHGIASPEELPAAGFEPKVEEGPTNPQFVSVVLCTRNRPEGAALTVTDLLKLNYPNYEVIVIDNASRDDSTKKIIDERFGGDERLRYVRENRPGLSYARNRGVAEAKGEIIAFTDDDVHVDEFWLEGVTDGFRSHENVGCVTGLVPSAELDNAVQQYFDERYTWGTNLQRRVFDMVDNRDDSILYPYSAGLFGTGANFAFDAETLRSIGSFDTAFGAGSPTGGGEDLDAFVKVLLSGKKIVQEPSSIIWHVHRAEIEHLSKQMFYYGVGLGAFITKYLVNPKTGFSVARRVVPGLMKIRKISTEERSRNILPARILLTELVGMAYGPIAYVKGLRNRRDIDRRATRGEFTSD